MYARTSIEARARPKSANFSTLFVVSINKFCGLVSVKDDQSDKKLFQHNGA